MLYDVKSNEYCFFKNMSFISLTEWATATTPNVFSGKRLHS